MKKKDVKNHQLGIGTFYKQEKQIAQVFYDFEIEDQWKDAKNISGVVVIKEECQALTGELFLNLEDGRRLELLSIQTGSGLEKEFGVYHFTAQFVNISPSKWGDGVKFYFHEDPTKRGRPGLHKRAHIVRDEAEPNSESLCRAALKLEDWVLVEALSEDTHLCKRCEHLADIH